MDLACLGKSVFQGPASPTPKERHACHLGSCSEDLDATCKPLGYASQGAESFAFQAVRSRATSSLLLGLL